MKPRPFHFQNRRMLPWEWERLFHYYPKVQIGDISQLIIKKLSTLIGPVTSRFFSLIAIDGHAPYLRYGYYLIPVRIETARLVFHFILDKDARLLESGIKSIKSRTVRFRCIHSVITTNSSETVETLSIGISIKELGSNYLYLPNDVWILEYLYKILGPVTKTYKVKAKRVYTKLDDYNRYLHLSPRYFVANYSPDLWAFNRYLWTDYPNFIPKLSTEQVFFYLLYIHPQIKKVRRTTLSFRQRVRLGITLKDSQDSIINTIYYSLLQFVGSGSTVEAIEYTDFNITNIRMLNPCFLASFGNFYDNVNNYKEIKQFALNLAQGTEMSIKFKLFELLWD